MKKLVIFFKNYNFWFGCLFSILQLVIIAFIHIDGNWNYPMNKEEYLLLGGRSFDYYFGYWLYTSIDPSDLEISSRFISARIPIILIILLWSAGHKEWSRSEQKNTIYKKKIFMFITTIISLYYTYYSFVYIVKFWLK